MLPAAIILLGRERKRGREVGGERERLETERERGGREGERKRERG